jgi:hypothetical protein
MVVLSSLYSEHACFMWSRRSLLAQPSLLDSDVPRARSESDTAPHDGG